MAVGVLADRALAATRAAAGPSRGGCPCPWRRGHRLVGDPLLGRAHPRRAAGPRPPARPPRPRSWCCTPTTCPAMLADVWTWRVQHGVTPSWTWWLGHWARRDELPPRIDLAAVAAALGRPRRPRPRPPRRRYAAARDAAGRRHRPAPGAAVRRRRRAAHPGQRGADRVLVTPERHQRLLDQVLLPLLADERRRAARRTPAPAGLGAGPGRAPRRGRCPGLDTLCTASWPRCCPAAGGAGRHHGSRGPRRGPPGAAADPDSGPDERPDQTRGDRCDRREGGGAVSPTRVLLHVGTPKTGTSYLQDVLFRNRDHLEARGILYPADRFDAHFLAALDLMRLPWGGLEKEAVGAWDALADRVRGFDGTAIISHEILATASRTQIRRALESLGHPDTEIHVVLSARDLVRQIPAEWQENVKHRRTLRYAKFLRAASATPSARAGWPPGSGGCRRSPTSSPAGAASSTRPSVHVVTVPPPGAPPTLLWERFADTFGLTGDPARPRGRAGEPLAGRARDGPGPADQPQRQQGASSRRTTGRWSASCSPTRPCPGAPRARASRCRRTPARGPTSCRGPGSRSCASAGTTWSATSTSCSRRPRRRRSPTPTDPTQRQVNRASMDAIKALLVEAARMRETEADLPPRARRGAPGQLERAYLRPSYRAREKLVRTRRGQRLGPPGAGVLPPGAGQELAVGVAADPPRLEAVDRQRRPRHRRPAPAGRWWRPAACPPPG